MSERFHPVVSRIGTMWMALASCPAPEAAGAWQRVRLSHSGALNISYRGEPSKSGQTERENVPVLRELATA